MNHPLKWEFPGGKMEGEESAEDCLVREIREELEIEIEILRKLEPNEHQYGKEGIRLIPFTCKWITGRLNLKEHADYKWLHSKYLLDLDWVEADIPIVKNYLRELDGI